MYASNPLFWDRLPETVTATGYDATDLVNNTSFEGLGDYLKEKREAKIDRALLRTQNDNQQDLIDTLSSRDNNNAIFDYTLEDLENKMERKYPGLKEKYEWYLNGDEEPTLKPWP
jgi:hypothetical protein